MLYGPAPKTPSSRVRRRIVTVAAATASAFVLTPASPGLADDAPDASDMTPLPPWLSSISLPGQAPTCFGKAATMHYGLDDNHPDTIHGTRGDDVIIVESPTTPEAVTTKIFGDRGDDYICTSGRRNYHVWAEMGDDRVSTGGGHDDLFGGIGHDFLGSGAGNDFIHGGAFGNVGRGDTTDGGAHTPKGGDLCVHAEHQTNCE